jgi:hypothetical protein
LLNVVLELFNSFELLSQENGVLNFLISVGFGIDCIVLVLLLFILLHETFELSFFGEDFFRVCKCSCSLEWVVRFDSSWISIFDFENSNDAICTSSIEPLVVITEFHNLNSTTVSLNWTSFVDGVSKTPHLEFTRSSRFSHTSNSTTATLHDNDWR